jgi:hypothetical protein
MNAALTETSSRANVAAEMRGCCKATLAVRKYLQAANWASMRLLFRY